MRGYDVKFFLNAGRFRKLFESRSGFITKHFGNVIVSDCETFAKKLSVFVHASGTAKIGYKRLTFLKIFLKFSVIEIEFCIIA